MQKHQAGQSRIDTLLTLALLLAVISVGGFLTHTLLKTSPAVTLAGNDNPPTLATPTASPIPAAPRPVRPRWDASFGRGRYIPIAPSPTPSPR